MTDLRVDTHRDHSTPIDRVADALLTFLTLNGVATACQKTADACTAVANLLGQAGWLVQESKDCTAVSNFHGTPCVHKEHDRHIPHRAENGVEWVDGAAALEGKYGHH